MFFCAADFIFCFKVLVYIIFVESLQELQDMSSVVVLRIIECFGRYHKTLSPEGGPPEVDQLPGMSYNSSRTSSFL